MAKNGIVVAFWVLLANIFKNTSLDGQWNNQTNKQIIIESSDLTWFILKMIVAISQTYKFLVKIDSLSNFYSKRVYFYILYTSQ